MPFQVQQPLQVPNEGDEELLTEDESGAEVTEEAADEPEDLNVYDDYGGGSGQAPPSYYGGGGGGGGGVMPQAPLPAATMTPAVPVEAQPAAPSVVPAPQNVPPAVTDFIDKAKGGKLTPGDVKRAAEAAKDAGMHKAAGKIVEIGKRAGAIAPKPAPPVPPRRGGAVSRRPPRVQQAPAGRKLGNLEDEMTTQIENMEMIDVADIEGGIDGLGQDDEMVLDDSNIGPEGGGIPGFEMDESGEYADEVQGQVDMQPYEPGAVPGAPYGVPGGGMPAAYGYPQQYAPSGGMSPTQAGYGYQQPSPYGYQQQGYGYDPYAQQGYDQYGYQQQQAPTGYDPQTGQPIYGSQQPVNATSLFPPGTPQVIIDAATAIQNGTATLELIQAAVTQANSMGYSTLANQLIAMYQQAGGQWSAAGAPVGGGGRYCTAGEDPATAGCTAKPSAAATTAMFGPLPTDPAGCKAEASTILATATFKAAQKAMKAKTPMTAEQKAYYARYSQLLACSGISKAGGTAPGPGRCGMQFLLAIQALPLGGGNSRCGNRKETEGKSDSCVRHYEDYDGR